MINGVLLVPLPMNNPKKSFCSIILRQISINKAISQIYSFGWFAVFIFISLVVSGAESPSWHKWLDARNKGDALPFPDFSYAGYEAGEQTIPKPTGPVFQVTDYGAIPNSSKSAKAAIRKAIAAASVNGGVVFFPKGQYIAHTTGDDNESITISRSDVVIKGEGAGPGGTVLRYDSPMTPVNTTSPLEAGAPLFRWQSALGDKKLTVLAADTRPGTFTIQVQDASTIRAGDLILLNLTSTAAVSTFMEGYNPEPTWTHITKEGINFQERHQVLSVQANTVRLRECVYLPLKAAWNVTVERYGALTHCGVEDIHFVGNWHGSFVHHRSWMDDGGFTCLRLGRVVDSWVRRCRFTDFNSPIQMVQGLRDTVMEIAIEGNGGHNTCSIGNSTAIWAGLIEVKSPEWHGPGVNSGSIADVFWCVRWTEKTSAELHASQPWGTLYDDCVGGLLYAREGGALQNLPNHLGKLLYWNFMQVGQPIPNYSFWLTDKKWGREVKPLVIGWHGSPTTFKQDTCESVESLGTPVIPDSLWAAQLALRLGKLPDWIARAQAEWPIMLKSWGI